MSIKKRILVSAVSMALVGAVGSANALVNLDAEVDKTNGHVYYATQEKVVETGTPIPNNSNLLSITTKLGSSIAEGTSKYLRFDFVNASFDNPASRFTLRVNGANTADINKTDGGGANQTHVIFEVKGGPSGLDNDAATYLYPGVGGGTIQVKNQETATVQYRLFETNIDALNQTNALKDTGLATYFGWEDAQNAECNPNPGNGVIDPGQPTKFIYDQTSDNPFKMTMRATSNVRRLNGSQISDVDAFGSNPVVTVSGNFEAFINGQTQLNGYLGVVDNAGTKSVIKPRTFTARNFFIKPDGETPMSPTDFVVEITPDADAISDAKVALPNTCGSLTFGGSTDRTDMVTNPAGTFEGFIRIVNPSREDGPVSLVVYNDAGESVGPFPLSEVGSLPGSLVAQSSTPMIPGGDILDAAQARNPGFNVDNGKMRIEVRAPFGGDANNDNGGQVFGGSPTGVNIQSFSVSTDGTTLTPMF